MEKIKICFSGAILIGLFILVHAEAWGEDWRLYYQTGDGGSFYYDSESMAHPSQGTIKISLKAVYSEKGRDYFMKTFGKRYKNLSHGMILSEINCLEKTVRSLSEQAFSNGGEILYSSKKVGEWEIIVPGTNAEGLYQVLCK